VNVAFIALLVDFGLVVLIWMVQLIVYPSFLFYKGTQLITWHTKYTPRITKIVAPLMFAQLSLSVFGLFQGITAYSILYAALVLSMWILTISVFIPIHEKIQEGSASTDLLQRLVRTNCYRTAVWTFIFLLTLAKVLY